MCTAKLTSVDAYCKADFALTVPAQLWTLNVAWCGESSHWPCIVWTRQISAESIIEESYFERESSCSIAKDACPDSMK